MTEKTNKLSRRMVALVWLFAVAVVIGVLLYLQQIAVLYVLASLAIVALLLIVGFSDLERIGSNNSAEGFGGRVE